MASGIYVLLAVVSFTAGICALPPGCKFDTPLLNERRSLYGVKCSKAELADVPSDFPKSISYLDVEMDSFPRLTSSSFRNYPKLQYLALIYCYIEFIEDDTFSSLTKLIYLDLSGNGILELPPMPSSIQTLVLNSMTKKASFFSSDRTVREITSLKSSLEKLWLRKNDLKALPPFLRELRNLNTISVSRNQISLITVDDIAPLCSLKELDFTNNVLAREGACDCLAAKSWMSERSVRVHNLTCPDIPSTDTKKCDTKSKSLEYFECKSITFLSKYWLLFLALLVAVVVVIAYFCYHTCINRRISSKLNHSTEEENELKEAAA